MEAAIKRWYRVITTRTVGVAPQSEKGAGSGDMFFTHAIGIVVDRYSYTAGGQLLAANFRNGDSLRPSISVDAAPLAGCRPGFRFGAPC